MDDPKLNDFSAFGTIFGLGEREQTILRTKTDGDFRMLEKNPRAPFQFSAPEL